MPQHGAYILTFFANADGPGAQIGIDVNGQSHPGAPVDVREPGNYSQYSWGLILSAGDTLRVWMYSPANGARVMLDDVTLSAYSGPR